MKKLRGKFVHGQLSGGIINAWNFASASRTWYLYQGELPCKRHRNNAKHARRCLIDWLRIDRRSIVVSFARDNRWHDRRSRGSIRAPVEKRERNKCSGNAHSRGIRATIIRRFRNRRSRSLERAWIGFAAIAALSRLYHGQHCDSRARDKVDYYSTRKLPEAAGQTFHFALKKLLDCLDQNGT